MLERPILETLLNVFTNLQKNMKEVDNRILSASKNFKMHEILLFFVTVIKKEYTFQISHTKKNFSYIIFSFLWIFSTFFLFFYYVLKIFITTKPIKWLVLFSSFYLLFFSLQLWYAFLPRYSGFQFLYYIQWFTFLGSYKGYLFGIDGISLFLVLLTTFLTPICLLYSWFSVSTNKFGSFFFILLFSVEIFVILIFTTMDLLLFFIFFESVLIPMFLLIGVWGSRERRLRASMLFFIYTFTGSIFMLIGIVVIYNLVGSTNYLLLSNIYFSKEMQIFLWSLFFLSFAVKIPIVPFHTWLPEAHVEAPTAGSVILAGLLLKLGTYGYLRYSVGIFPEANLYFSPLVFTIGSVSILYSSLAAIRQTDLKRIIAYSSVAHMNLVLMGMATNTLEGIQGSIFQMISHGVVSSALFLCIGILYERTHTRLINHYGGCVQTMPLFAFFFLSFILANIAFPSTCNFIGEILLFVAVAKKNLILCLISTIGMVLSAVYSLWLCNRVLFTNLKITYFQKPLKDLTFLEIFYLFPLLMLTFLLGIFPNHIFDSIGASSILLLIY